MSYCTPAKLRVALAPLSQLSAPGGTQTAADLGDPQLQDAIDQAESIINVAIGTRYVVPVAPIVVDGNDAIPHPIDFWARDIAAYLATCTYRGSIDFSNDDPIYRRFIVTIGSLNDIKNGIGKLDIPVSESGSNTTVGKAINPYLGKLFEPCDFDLAPSSYLPTGPTMLGRERGWW